MAVRSDGCSWALGHLDMPPHQVAMFYYFRATAHLDGGDLAAAVADAGQALAQEPGLMAARWLRANTADGLRRYDDAMADWNELIKQHPEMPQLYIMRGLTLDDQGHSTEAVAEESKAIELEGERATGTVLVDRAVSYTALRQFDRAQADTAEAIRREPNLPRAYEWQGKLDFLQGRFDAAVEDFTKAGDLDHADPYKALWLYLSLIRQGRAGEDELRSRLGQLDPDRWPTPLVKVMLGEAKPDAIATPTLPDHWSAADRRAGADCEIAFYRAEQLLARGDRDGARKLFAASVATGISEYDEYRFAKIELDQMGAK